MNTSDNRQPADEEWVSVNDHLDYGLGFVSSGIADEIEARFGVFPVFAMAGGWCQMVIGLETGHMVCVTDMDATFLTPVRRRTDEIGFTVGIYTTDQFEVGDSQWVLSAQVGAHDLVALISRAVSDYAAERPASSATTTWADSIDLGTPGTFSSLIAETPKRSPT